MLNPIDSYDLADLTIQKEILTPVEFTNITNGSTIQIDNTGNTYQEPIITIILNNDFLTGFTITNTSTEVSITIPSPTSNYASGSIFKVYADSVYLNDVEISATFSAPFVIAEDTINIISFTLPDNFSVNVSVSWLHPSPTETIISFVTGFQIHETRIQKQRAVNFLNKYSNGYITQSINGDFTIDKMLVDTWFEDENDYTYRITWQTDSNVTDINQQRYFLCNCRFNDLTWNRQDENIISEGVKGTFGKRLKG